MLRERGIDGQLIWGQGGSEPLADLLSGKAQLAVLDVPTVARAAERGLRVIGVFQVYGADTSMTFALGRAGIHAPAQLRGLKVAVPTAQGAAREALRAGLRVAELGLADVEMVVAPDLRPSLESGRVAAVTGSGHLARWFEARGQPLRYLPRGGWEVVPGPVLAIRTDYAASSRTTLVRLLEAIRAGILGVLDDPGALRGAASRLLGGDAGPDEPRRAQVDAVLVSLRNFDAEHGPGWANPERYAATDRYLRELGTTAGTTELVSAFVNDFLPRARA